MASKAIAPTTPVDKLTKDQRAYYNIVKELCDDQMQGRGAGTKGIVRARDYLIEQFKSAGLKPAYKKQYKGKFDFAYGMDISTKNMQIATADGDEKIDLKPGDFRVLGSAGGADLNFSLTFAGYGVRDKLRKYDSYAKTKRGELRGAAVIFRGEPMDEKGKSKWAMGERPWSSRAYAPFKIRTAKELGARALIMVAPKARVKDRWMGEGMLDMRRRRSNGRIPTIMITREVFYKVLKLAGEKKPMQKALELERDANAGKTALLKMPDVRITGKISAKRKEYKVHNVVGILPGKGKLAKQAVVIGAHYDHLGFGKAPFSVRDEPQPGCCYPGADDNASGTAAVVTLAKRYAARYANSDAPRRTIIFACFAGEECGLHGSRALTNELNELGFECADVSAMINFDMIGYLRDSKLSVLATGSALEFESLLEQASKKSKSPLKLNQMKAAISFSDHASFIRKRIPAMMLCSGLHPYYHTVKDVPAILNIPGALRIVNYADKLITEIATRKSKLTFNKISRRGLAYFGGAFAKDRKAPGCVLSKVIQGGPASRAGLRAGDIVLKWNGEKVRNRAHLARLIRAAKPGSQVKIVLKRGDDKKKLSLKLGRR